MRKYVVGVGLLAFALAGAAALGFAKSSSNVAHNSADDGEVVVTLDQVPDAVKATILEQLGSRTAVKIELDTENGSSVYDIEPSSGAEFMVSPTGEYLGTEADDGDPD